MGLDTILECENHRQAQQGPNVVHSSRHGSSKLKEKKTERKATRRDYVLDSLDNDLGGLSLSPCRRSMPCRPVGVKVEDSEVFKRGSVYQSSKEVRKLRKLRDERKKTKSALNDESFLSFEIVNHTALYCQKDAAVTDKHDKEPIASLKADMSVLKCDRGQNGDAVLSNTDEFLDLSFRLLPEEHLTLNNKCSNALMSTRSSSDSYLEICLLPDDDELSHPKVVPENIEKCLIKGPNLQSNENFISENNCSTNSKRDSEHILAKSLSTKVETGNSLHPLESELPKGSQRSRFSPIRKMLDPIKKSKSQRNPSLSKTETCNLTYSSSLNLRSERTMRRYLLSDLSSVGREAGCHDKSTNKGEEHHCQLIDKDRRSIVPSSPAHLHGLLKLESKQGVPSFEFSVTDMEDVLSARIWKTNNAFNWMYTFHTGKKNSCGGWGTRDRRRQSLPMVGQMQVSCYFCSELNGSGSTDNSAVTEFILYDIAHVKRSSSADEETHFSPEFLQPSRGTLSESLAADDLMDSSCSTVPDNCKNPSRASYGNHIFEMPASHPWSPVDLLPHLEVAAVVIKIPFGSRKTLKDRLRDDACYKQLTDSIDISMSGHGRDATSANPRLVSVKIVTTNGRHGLPSSEEGSPSPLLDRWKSGGGCDCGGWDMRCPITVFDNSGGESAIDIRESHLSLKLFVQGAKDNIPALTITTCDDGQYAVDFHAKFTKLQAFSICVAVLHSLEAFGISSQERSGQRLHSNSLKRLLEEEVRHLIEVVAKEEQKKVKRKLHQAPAPYAVDPPFSPIGRV